MKTNHKKNLLALVEGAMMLALAWVIDYVCALAPYNAILFPAGGSITIGMLPLVYFAFRHGAIWGMGAGLVFSGLQMLNSFYIPPAQTWWAVLLCVLLDYVIAFTVIGSASLFSKLFGQKNQTLRLTGYGMGAVIVCVLRYISSVLSGGILWGSYAPEGMNPWIYSLVYNGSYMLPNTVIAVLALALLQKPLGKFLRREDLKKA